ncbi:hypothetical protein Vretimale_17896 [Volvox reticuliferus]|uniref:RING-type domain-containing protein n=1 Tax=Volvox reticuliferus TaxID=1737510 RepID=A0A8J4GXD9_9CHLO|nr:hypothetical protein Vretifemale_1757 [Volvox reticuliferus]GIM15018.1 hypothetical protein Vretimale_17896 [Volvox reticuliferus]
MRKSLGRSFAKLSLEGEDNYWDEEEAYDGTDGYEEIASDALLVESNANKTNKDTDASEVCAICLSSIQVEDLAIIKGCEHEYCVNCILQWAVCKDAPWCPQCKTPFNYLYCYRLLDGTMSDMPVEESVCLLKRASWFVEHVKTLENGKAVSASMAAEEVLPAEWADSYQDYDGEEDEYDEDEQIEKYYFSSAAGRARVVLGNRRLGENGYMRAGRMYARPAGSNNTSQAGGSGSVGIGKAGKGRAASGKAVIGGNDLDAAGAGGSGSTSHGSAGARVAGLPTGPTAGLPQAVKGQGRRAKRNARRAAADLEQL